jgi:hypothetical protein
MKKEPLRDTSKPAPKKIVGCGTQQELSHIPIPPDLQEEKHGSKDPPLQNEQMSLGPYWSKTCHSVPRYLSLRALAVGRRKG